MKKSVLVGAALWCLAAASLLVCAGRFLAYKDAGGGKVSAEGTKIVVYGAPDKSLIQGSSAVTVSVCGENSFVYNLVVNNSHTWVDSGYPPLADTPMTYFDFEGTADIAVTFNEISSAEMTDIRVTPLSAGITPKISGMTVNFSVTEPGFYTVEYGGNVAGAVHIFANPLETDVPDEIDDGVYFISPGVWDLGTFAVDSGKTVYIAGGAVVYGGFVSVGGENVTIRGRGIIAGDTYDTWLKPGQAVVTPIDFRRTKGFKVEGVILANPNSWALNVLSAENGDIENVKVITSRPNGDGITLQSAKNVYIHDSFVRTWDDSLVVKNYEGSTNNIVFDKILVWTDLAQSCEIGYETNKGQINDAMITNVTFRNITILHNFHKPVISIHNSDSCLVSNIKYENIVVEDAQMGRGDAGSNNQLIDFTIAASGWSSTRGRGKIENVTIDGVTVLGGNFPSSRIEGYDETHSVKNVSINNLTILGEKITDKDAGKFRVNPFVENLTIGTGGGEQ